MLPAGELNKRIVVQTNTTGTHATSNLPTNSWGTLTTVWGKVDHSRGNESREGDIERGIQRADFTVRHNPTTKTITVADRISYDSKTWDILGISEVGFNEGLLITAEWRQ